jgi:hypothetical protein
MEFIVEEGEVLCSLVETTAYILTSPPIVSEALAMQSCTHCVAIFVFSAVFESLACPTSSMRFAFAH